jgi:nucleoside-triphosphatase THEP1
MAAGRGEANRVTAARIGLLTGPVGIGKTTVAERVIALVQRRGLTCGGLLAPALVDPAGQKIGIWGVDVRSGERRTLARTDLELGGPTIGPYSFDAAALDWALAAIEKALGKCDLLVVDEIGKLELWHGRGLAPVLPGLASGEARRSLVLVRDHLLLELQARLAAVEQVVLQVNKENREEMPPQVLRRLL